MSSDGSRRKFLLGTVSSGLAIGAYNLNSLRSISDAQDSTDVGQNADAQDAAEGIDFGYLAKGLAALARAHRSNTMAGHLGAAVIAGHFISQQHPDLKEGVYRGIERELERIIAGGSVFSPRANAGISVAAMFEPFPKESPNENLVDGIAEALAGNLDQTRQSGHNVIFASSAIRALKRHPEFCTPSITDGIRKLISAFDGKTPGSGYYGKQRGRIDGRKVRLADSDALPPFADLKDMAASVLDHLIEHASEVRIGYGGLTHLINHAAALVELSNYGYRELALQGLAAHHQHMQLWRTLPNVAEEPGQQRRTLAPHDPRTAAFWQSGNLPNENAKLTHRIKTLYGFDALTPVIPQNETRQAGNVNLRYLM